MGHMKESEMSIRAIASAIVVAGTLGLGSASATPLVSPKPAGTLKLVPDRKCALGLWALSLLVCPNYYGYVRPYWGPRRHWGFHGRPYRYGFHGHRRFW